MKLTPLSLVLLCLSCSRAGLQAPASDLPEEVIEAPARALVIGYGNPNAEGAVGSSL